MPTTPAPAKYSELPYASDETVKAQYPWYVKNIDKYVVPETRLLLSEYAGVPEKQQSEHVHRIRDQAWKIRAYPCTGAGIWLVPFLPRLPVYSRVLQVLKDGGVYLDVGCFMGVDMRRLVHAGAPSESMYGVDIVSHWDVGYKLFRDEDLFKATFIEADIFDSKNEGLKKLGGRVDVINVGAVLHQFTWERQIEASKRLVEFSKSGTILVGYQVGAEEAGNWELEYVKGLVVWRHNPQSWGRMWTQVGEETDTKWDAKAWLRDWDGMGWNAADHAWQPGDARIIVFVVERRK